MDSPSAIALMNLLSNFSRLFQIGKERAKEKEPLAAPLTAPPAEAALTSALESFNKDIAMMCLSLVAVVAIIAVVAIAVSSRQSA